MITGDAFGVVIGRAIGVAAGFGCIGFESVGAGHTARVGESAG